MKDLKEVELNKKSLKYIIDCESKNKLSKQNFIN